MYVVQRTEAKMRTHIGYSMLYDFLISNRDELIRRCRSEEAMRHAPQKLAAIDHGVPLFLQQLADILLLEQSSLNREVTESESAPSASPVGPAAALHGAELLHLGFSMSQLVHGYGDVCQSIMNLAIEEKYPITSEEFRTLNRCLDNAIAGAVTAFGSARQVSSNDDAESLCTRLDTISEEHRRLVFVATQAYSSIRSGQVGVTGPTSNLLMLALDELRHMAEQTIPDINVEQRKRSSLNNPT